MRFLTLCEYTPCPIDSYRLPSSSARLKQLNPIILSTGTRLGPYQIVAPIGAGGMGEVYKATDTKLGRDVAIKILPSAVAQDPERLARFEREAKVLASLNHPNIAQIYGVEDHALVMELVPGQTLSGRIAAGPVPLDEALRIAAQIAEALAAAHEREVIHRDLKPANVMVTPDGRVKVLDFGLAKPFAEVSAADNTLTAAMTQAGTVLGTPGYMSPEQTRGRAVDKRTDIWALGCVLYELLTQCRAFRGETLSDTTAAVLEREPDWDALPISTPPKVCDLLRRCLCKDVRRRPRDAGDIALEIEEALATPAGAKPFGIAGPRQKSILSRTAPLITTAIVIAAALAGAFFQRRLGSSSPASLTHLTALLPPDYRFLTGICPDVAVSPDGKSIAYIGIRERTSQIFLRPLDSSEATPIPGTEGVSDTVFFSPDGRWLAFLQGSPNTLRKIPIGGGAPVTVVKTQGCGGDWGPDDQILISRRDGIFQVPAGGGALKSLIRSDSEKGELGLAFPQLLPGGKVLLFTIQMDQGFQIVAQELASGERHVLIKGDGVQGVGGLARYAPGFLIYSQAGALFAMPFNLARLEVTGPPVRMAQGAGGIGAQFGQSRSADTLVYVQAEPEPPRTLVWVDRKGVEEPVGAAPGNYLDPRLSPDGQRVVLAANSDIWIYDIARRTLTRITVGGDNRSPIWTPDGRRITHSHNGGVSWSPADGSSREETLWTGNFGLPTSWSPDGKRLLFTNVGPNNQTDVSVLSVEGERKATPVVQSAFVESHGVFSPDGRRFAYDSNESGQSEIYLQEFPGPGVRVQVSSQGGSNPLWARNGRELFYRSGDKLMAVDIKTEPVFEIAVPRALFEGRYNLRGMGNYDVSADGRRFLLVKSGGSAPPVTQLNVILNWPDDVKQRAAAK